MLNFFLHLYHTLRALLKRSVSKYKQSRNLSYHKTQHSPHDVLCVMLDCYSETTLAPPSEEEEESTEGEQNKSNNNNKRLRLVKRPRLLARQKTTATPTTPNTNNNNIKHSSKSKWRGETTPRPKKNRNRGKYSKMFVFNAITPPPPRSMPGHAHNPHLTSHLPPPPTRVCPKVPPIFTHHTPFYSYHTPQSPFTPQLNPSPRPAP